MAREMGQIRDQLRSVSRAAPEGTMNVIVTAFTGLGYALGARALLLLALVGAFVLAVLAMQNQTNMGLGVLIAYAAFAILPVCILEIRKTRL